MLATCVTTAMFTDVRSKPPCVLAAATKKVGVLDVRSED